MGYFPILLIWTANVATVPLILVVLGLAMKYSKRGIAGAVYSHNLLPLPASFVHLRIISWRFLAATISGAP